MPWRAQEFNSESLKQVALLRQVVSEQKAFWFSQSHMGLDKGQIHGKLLVEQIILTLTIYSHLSSAMDIHGFTNTSSHLIHFIYLHEKLCDISISSFLLETRKLTFRVLNSYLPQASWLGLFEELKYNTVKILVTDYGA